MGIDSRLHSGYAERAPLFDDLAGLLLSTPALAGGACRALAMSLLHQFRAELLCYTDIHRDTRVASMPVLVSRASLSAPVSRRLRRLLGDDPSASSVVRPGDAPMLVADGSDTYDWDRTDVARALREQFGAMDHLAIQTEVEPRRFCAWVLMRPEPFTEQERDLARRMSASLRQSRDREVTPLTARERDVLCLLRDGLTAEAIGRRLQISRHTVGKHVQHVYNKLDVHDRLVAVRVAQRQGLIGDE